MNAPLHFAFRARNLASTVLLLALLIGASAGLTYWVLGSTAALWLSVALTLGAMMWGNAPTGWVLRARRAQPIDPRQPGGLLALRDELARRAGLQHAPALYWIPTPQMEALTVGRGANAAVLLSAGMLRALSPRELTGVLAHEISHLRNHDLTLLGVARGVGRFGRFVARFALFVAVLAIPGLLFSGQPVPWMGLLVLVAAPRLLIGLERAISRAREFDADASAVELTGDPRALASALARVEAIELRATRWAAMVAPVTEIPPWLRSHPETQERIARLNAITARTALV